MKIQVKATLERFTVEDQDETHYLVGTGELILKTDAIVFNPVNRIRYRSVDNRQFYHMNGSPCAPVPKLY